MDKLEHLRDLLSRWNNEVRQCRANLGEAEDKLADANEQVRKLRNRIRAIEYSEKISDSTVDWEYLLTAPHKSQKDYKAMLAAIAKYGPKSIMATGYRPEILQQSFTIYMNEGDEQELVEYQQFFKYILPIIKSHDGYKYFGILESSCGEYGDFYEFQARDNGDYAVIHRRYRDRKDMYVTKSLDNALRFIQSNLGHKKEE